jgi:hypothetical protein
MIGLKWVGRWLPLDPSPIRNSTLQDDALAGYYPFSSTNPVDRSMY